MFDDVVSVSGDTNIWDVEVVSGVKGQGVREVLALSSSPHKDRVRVNTLS